MFNVKIKKSHVFINLRSDVGRLPAKVPVPPTACAATTRTTSIISHQTLYAVHIAHIVHQCQHSYQLRPFILLPDHVLNLLGELPGDLILHLVHLPVHHLVTLVNHLAALVRHLANLVDQRTQQNGNHI